jgi:hypothetical protein
MPRFGESVGSTGGGGSGNGGGARRIGAAMARAIATAGATMATVDFVAAHYCAAELLAPDSPRRRRPGKSPGAGGMSGSL